MKNSVSVSTKLSPILLMLFFGRALKWAIKQINYHGNGVYYTMSCLKSIAVSEIVLSLRSKCSDSVIGIFIKYLSLL